jgi:hypothetical protein
MECTNYKAFDAYANRISTLNQAQIESPYLAIKNLSTKRTQEEFLATLRMLQDIIYRPYAWKKYNPIVLYDAYLDVTELIDIMFLINKYSPQLSNRLPTTRAETESCPMQAINKLFARKDTGDPEQEEAKPVTILAYVFTTHALFSMKEDLYTGLKAGLDLSYTPDDKEAYLGLEYRDLLHLYSSVEDLVTELYLLALKDASEFPDLTNCEDVKFSIDTEHPSVLPEECIDSPETCIKTYFNYDFNQEGIYSGFMELKALLFKTGAWNTSQNPGNLIEAYDRIIQIIEIIWLIDQYAQLWLMVYRYNPTEKHHKLVQVCNKEEVEDPMIVYREFFEYMRVYDWKAILEEFLRCSLNNNQCPDPINKEEIDFDFNLLIKFFEVTYLLICDI